MALPGPISQYRLPGWCNLPISTWGSGSNSVLRASCWAALRGLRVDQCYISCSHPEGTTLTLE